jgi:polyisoprenoid-binding protein YceI
VRRQLLALVAVCGAAIAPAAGLAATAWQVEREQSRLLFVPKVAGGEFEGRCESFDAAISFDPADLGHSRLVVDVNLAGAVTGDAERDAALWGADFLAIRQWPRARFVATRIVATGGRRFEAFGTLRLRDVTRAVRVPFEFIPVSGTDTARMRGRTAVARLDFGVGQGDWRDTDWIADEVRIEFDLLLRRTH